MTITPLFDPPARRRGPETSKAAARSMRGEPAKTIRVRVLAWFIERGSRGGTGEELAIALNLRPQTATPRIRELVQAGRLRDSGDRRRTSSGRRAIVWRATAGAAGGVA